MFKLLFIDNTAAIPIEDIYKDIQLYLNIFISYFCHCIAEIDLTFSLLLTESFNEGAFIFETGFENNSILIK